ncbi:hypothetical protein DFH05DRAFT_1518584 [Lentinula detonsa]|uniref:Secreted protein n=1 Tax=Lentinula detonsa TaxID=2804962 RepID=A0A9W8U2K7_9AGAR|nr:hypothetical protein DFH05DRAFT_1518584 [Lentinula detonsa]
MYLKFAFLVLATSLFSVVSMMPVQDSNSASGNNGNNVVTHRRPKPPRRNLHPDSSIPDPPLRIKFRQTEADLPILPPNPNYSAREIVETYMQRVYHGVSNFPLRFDYVNEYQVLDPHLVWFQVEEDVIGRPCFRDCVVTVDWRHVQAGCARIGTHYTSYQAIPDYRLYGEQEHAHANRDGRFDPDPDSDNSDCCPLLSTPCLAMTRF